MSTTTSHLPLSRAHLEIIEGPGLGRRILLREGQVRYVGRTTQADDACPENQTMSSVHFSVRWFAGKCELKDLNSANGTWRHGKKVTEALLSSGDEIKAGKCTFRLVVDDGVGASFGSFGSASLPAFQETSLDDQPPPVKPITPATGTVESVLHSSGLAVLSAAALPATAQLSDEAKAMLVDDMPIPQFIELLASREQFLDALRTVAHSLAKRSAVQWACQCVRAAAGDDINKTDEAAVKAAEAWAADPSEDLRRKAQTAADATQLSTAAGWAAMAAFFSSGSLGPANTPVVPPEPHLTSHAAGGAVMLAAVATQPEKAPQRYAEFLRLAQNFMN
jgi:FHA domain